MTFPTTGAAVTWSFGEHTLTALSDGWFDDDMAHVVTRIPADEAARAQRAALRPERPRISHTMYLLRGPGIGPTLIDAGMGSGWGPTMGHLTSSLALAGLVPGDVERVLLTHLHLDHSAGLLDDDGGPRFDRAGVTLHTDEAAYWLDPRHAAAACADQRPWFDGAQAAMAPYVDRTEVFRGAAELAPGVVAEPLPGHTPGHTGYRVTAGEVSVLLWGDVVHLPAVQAPRPEAGVVFDVDGAAAVRTRARVLDRAATDRFLVAGGHTEFPGVARVRTRPDGGYDVVPELWSAHGVLPSSA